METVAILCMTFLVVLVVYCIIPIKKMKAVNKELKSLLQVLPFLQSFYNPFIFEKHLLLLRGIIVK